MASRESRKTASRLAVRCAALASLGAAVIHFAVAPAHWRDWLPSGVFFAAIAVFQLVWAILAWRRPTAWVLAAGMVANAGSSGLWVFSRIVGAPFGPHAGQPEAVDAAGICVLLLQCYVVMGAAWAWPRRHRAGHVPGLGRAMVLLGANTVMAAAVTVGLASGLQAHHHHHGNSAETGLPPATRDAHVEADHRHAHPLAPPERGSIPPESSLAESGRAGDHRNPGAATNGVGPEAPAATVEAEAGLPVTDMGLTAPGSDHDHTHDHSQDHDHDHDHD